MSAPPPLPPVPADGDVKGGKTLNIIIWLFTAITTLVFAGRIYSRKFITKNLGWDDAILGLSMALLYIQCAFVSISVQYGLGRHQYYLLISNPQDVFMVVKWQLYSQPIGILGTTIPKIAVTMLIIKLLGLSSLSKTFLWSANIALNAISIVCIAISFAQCTPTSTYWTRVGGKCWNPTIVANFAITQGALSAFTDFCLAIYPIVVIKDLQMPLQRKIAVCVLMGFGSLAGVAAIIRTTKLAKLAQQTDFTWSIWTLVLWVAIECCVIIVCACMPSIRPLFRKFYENSVGSTFPSLFSKRKSGMGFKSYSAGFSPAGSMQETKISAASSDDGSEISLKKSGGIRSTTDVEIRHSLRANQV